MAVTKIRKVSSTTLLVLLALSVLIFVLFFAGGSELDAKGNKDYAFTGILLYWTYFLFIVTVLATLFFAGRSIATNKTKDVVSEKKDSWHQRIVLGRYRFYVAYLLLDYNFNGY